MPRPTFTTGPTDTIPAIALALACALCHAFGALSCAKDPQSSSVPYDGYVGTGKDWNADVDHVELTIDRAVVGRVISPLVYGYNSIANPAASGIAALRAGGNRFTAYNWENGASNAGKDFMYQNDGFLVQGSAMGDTPGEAVRPMLDTARRIGATAVVTVPNVDYVAADKGPGGDVRESGADYLTTRFKKNLPTRGSGATGSADAVYQDEFVSWVKANYSDVPVLFSMDNEPDLWGAVPGMPGTGTHPEVHPLPVGYDELVMRNTAYARAVKAVWPEAPVLGFVSFGWSGYVNLNGAPGGKGDFVTYYLERMKSAEAAAGVRLIDYMDLHWYPEATGAGATGAVRVAFSRDTSPLVAQARVQAPRSLWDPGYKETSWVASSAGGPIALIPRMRQKIATSYPGTALAFTEWNYGAGGDISGAVATADVLGIFGREGVGLANNWPSGNEAFTQAAYRAYRNYDGAGARFGDTSVSARTSSILSSSVYASVDSTDTSRLVIVAINKRASSTTATVRLAGDSSATFASVWALTAATANLQRAAVLTADAPGTFTYAMPPLSVSVLVPSAAAPPPAPAPDAGATGPAVGPVQMSDAAPPDQTASDGAGDALSAAD